MRTRPFSLPDPGNIYYEKPGLAATLVYTSLSGKTPRSLAINPAEDTLIMICAGQSLATNLIADTFNPVNASKVDNLAWYDGNNYAATTPLLGTSWNGTIGTSVNFNHKVADGIISNGKFDRVIIVPVALPGTTINWWANEGSLTTEAVGYWRMIAAAAMKLRAQGITPDTPGVKFLVKWNQGESDRQASTTQANYTAYFNTMKSNVDAFLPGVKWMVARESWFIGTVSAAVQSAQTALVNGTTIFAGENMDSIDNTGREADQTHLNASGGNSAAAMGIAAITAISF